MKSGLSRWVMGIVLGFSPWCPAATHAPRAYLQKPQAWFKSDEAKSIAENILSWQSDLGGWPKNVETAAAPYTGKREDLKPTFDNDATTDELRYLARMFVAIGDPRYRFAVERGIDHILKAQYPSGGWPQFYPPDKAYHRYITFNDDAMVRVMELLRETYTDDHFAFIDDGRKKSAKDAFEHGVQCILKCQIKVNGKLTAWCAQHDPIDYSPRPGRSYELVSLSGGESVGIVRLLMSIDRPSPQIVQSIDAAVQWFLEAKIKGIRVDRRPDPKSPKGFDKVVVEDPAAPPIWARFYEIGTNRPIFSDRDGVAKHHLAEIGYERRNGYSWLNDWPKKLLEREYPAWKAKLAGN